MNPTSMPSLPLENEHSPYEQSITNPLSTKPLVTFDNVSFSKEIGSFDTILAHMADAIIVTTSNERIVYVNPAWEKLNGYSLDEVRGLTPAILNSSAKQPLWKDVFAEIKNGNPWHSELINRRADGSEYEAALTIAPIQNDDGESTYFVGVSRDATEKNTFLAAQEAFAMNVAHELRTPLTNIKFYLSLLEKGAADSRERYMDTLKREVTRLQAITEDILLLSQFDADKVELCVEPIDLHSLVMTVITAHTKLASANQVEVHYHLDKDAFSVDVAALKSDSVLLTELLGQLLTNAIAYTDVGGKVEVATTICEKDDQTWYALSVQDNGFGIAPSESERIFERFYRGRSGYEMAISGTGLGLTICRQIAQHLGGHIELESTLQVGSTFTLFLPAVTQQIQPNSVRSRYAVLS